MRTGAAQAGRRRLGVVSVTLARNVATHIQTHTQRHTHRDTQLRHSLELCSYPLFARTLRHFSTTFYGAAHPLSPSSPFPTYSRKNIPPKQKLCFHFPLAFLCQPAFFLSFFLFWESCLWNSFYYAACPALPSFLSLSLSPLGPSVSVSVGSTVLIDNKKIIHFIQRCRRNAAMPSI